MRSDSQLIAWIAPLFGDPSEDLTPKQEDIMERIEGALSVGHRGRECLDAAMGAVLLEIGDSLPLRTGVQRVADYLEQCNREELPSAEPLDELGFPMFAPIEDYVLRGAAIAAKIDEMQRDQAMLDAEAPVCPHCGKIDPSEDCLS